MSSHQTESPKNINKRKKWLKKGTTRPEGYTFINQNRLENCAISLWLWPSSVCDGLNDGNYDGNSPSSSDVGDMTGDFVFWTGLVTFAGRVLDRLLPLSLSETGSNRRCLTCSGNSSTASRKNINEWVFMRLLKCIIFLLMIIIRLTRVKWVEVVKDSFVPGSPLCLFSTYCL